MIAHTYYPNVIVRNGEAQPLDGKTFVHDLIMQDAFDFIEKNAKAGQVQYRTDKNGIVHGGIGKIDFELTAIKENLEGREVEWQTSVRSSWPQVAYRTCPIAARPAYSRMRLSLLPGWDRRKTSRTVPTSLCVSISWLRVGL